MTGSLATVAYIGATILFILSLGGLSNPETARRGNLYGMVGMAIAVLATVLGPRVTAAGLEGRNLDAAASGDRARRRRPPRLAAGGAKCRARSEICAQL